MLTPPLVIECSVFFRVYSKRKMVGHGTHFAITSVAGDPMDREQKTRIGRALEQLSVELITAYSPRPVGVASRCLALGRAAGSRTPLPQITHPGSGQSPSDFPVASSAWSMDQMSRFLRSSRLAPVVTKSHRARLGAERISPAPTELGVNRGDGIDLGQHICELSHGKTRYLRGNLSGLALELAKD
jgi:hypothetical protein